MLDFSGSTKRLCKGVVAVANKPRTLSKVLLAHIGPTNYLVDCKQLVVANPLERSVTPQAILVHKKDPFGIGATFGHCAGVPFGGCQPPSGRIPLGSSVNFTRPLLVESKATPHILWAVPGDVELVVMGVDGPSGTQVFEGEGGAHRAAWVESPRSSLVGGFQVGGHRYLG